MCASNQFNSRFGKERYGDILLIGLVNLLGFVPHHNNQDSTLKQLISLTHSYKATNARETCGMLQLNQMIQMLLLPYKIMRLSKTFTAIMEYLFSKIVCLR